MNIPGPVSHPAYVTDEDYSCSHVCGGTKGINSWVITELRFLILRITEKKHREPCCICSFMPGMGQVLQNTWQVKTRPGGKRPSVSPEWSPWRNRVHLTNSHRRMGVGVGVCLQAALGMEMEREMRTDQTAYLAVTDATRISVIAAQDGSEGQTGPESASR